MSPAAHIGYHLAHTAEVFPGDGTARHHSVAVDAEKLPTGGRFLGFDHENRASGEAGGATEAGGTDGAGGSGSGWGRGPAGAGVRLGPGSGWGRGPAGAGVRLGRG